MPDPQHRLGRATPSQSHYDIRLLRVLRIGQRVHVGGVESMGEQARRHELGHLCRSGRVHGVNVDQFAQSIERQLLIVRRRQWHRRLSHGGWH